MTKIVNLMRSGSILGTQFDVYEAHIPYLLQIFIDYNLYGMGFVNFSKIKFRLPVPRTRYLLCSCCDVTVVWLNGMVKNMMLELPLNVKVVI